MIRRVAPAHFALALAVAFLAAAPYLAGGTSRSFIALDDNNYIYDNPQVRQGLNLRTALWALTSTEDANWYPLRRLSHLVDVSVFGFDARGHHLVSVGWHAAAALLLFSALHLMTGMQWRSFVLAALFGIHPLQVESVAWAAERSSVLAGFFFALTLLLWARHARRPCRATRIAVVLCCALGLMSKPVLVTLPFVLLLLDAWPLGRMSPPGSPPWRFSASLLGKRLLEQAPLLLLATAAGGIALVAHRQADSLATLETLPLGARLANAALSYWRYVGKLLWPADLAVWYAHPGTGLPAGRVALAALFLAALTMLVLLPARRRPWLATGWLWFAGTLVPMIGIVQFGSHAMADRFAYLPSIGFFLALVWVAAEEPPPRLRQVIVFGPLAGTALAALVLAATLQARLWRDSETLFAHTLAVTEDNWMIRNNYAVVLASEGRHEEAIANAREALRLKPGFVDALVSLGNSQAMLGLLEESVGSYREALRLQPEHGDPRSLAQLHYNLGTPLAALGRHEEAAASFREALRLQPDLAYAYVNLGSSLAMLGRLVEAAANFGEALRLQPDFPEAWYNLGLALAQLGRREEAVGAFREALRLRPEYPAARAALAREGGGAR